MAGGKHVSEEKSEPSKKCTAADLRMNIRMVRKYEHGQSLSSVACKLGFVLSAMNTIMKDVACMKEHINFNFHLMAYVCRLVQYLICQSFITSLYYWYMFGLCINDVRYDD
jgi:hypothetical protein